MEPPKLSPATQRMREIVNNPAALTPEQQIQAEADLLGLKIQADRDLMFLQPETQPASPPRTTSDDQFEKRFKPKAARKARR